MRYLMLIIENPEDRRTRPTEVGREKFERMVRYSEGLKARGVLQATESLRTEGVRIEMRDGKRIVVDGPFAEAKEMVGGFFLLECASKAEAIAIAGECPASAWASIEVRELGPCFT
jgi:hypothetical protein